MEVFCEMIEFFKSLATYIEVIVDFVISFFTNLITLISYIPKSLMALTSAFTFLPPFFTVPLLAIISVSVLIAILNKLGG